MEDVQKKQIEIIRSVIAGNDKARKEIECAVKDIEQAVKSLVDGLSVYDAISGHSECVMAASGLLGLKQQMQQLL